MTNPFEALDISDDEEGFQPTQQEQKVKRTHHEKRLYKQQQAQQAAQQPTQVAPPAPAANLNEPEFPHHRENAKQVRNTRAPPTPQTKKLGEGHYHDRRSGTGRVYESSHLVISLARKVEDGEMWEI